MKAGAIPGRTAGRASDAQEQCSGGPTPLAGSVIALIQSSAHQPALGRALASQPGQLQPACLGAAPDAVCAAGTPTGSAPYCQPQLFPPGPQLRWRVLSLARAQDQARPRPSE